MNHSLNLREGTLFFFKSLMMVLCLLNGGCLATVWTGAQMVYDRHTVYKQFNDYQLSFRIKEALFAEGGIKCSGCAVDMAVFHGDVLIAGVMPTEARRQEVYRRIQSIGEYRRLFFQVSVSNKEATPYQDSWITTKIRTTIFADDSIDPDTFKVVTVNQVVYLMGEITIAQAKKVIEVARGTQGVVRVVKLFRYYQLIE